MKQSYFESFDEFHVLSFVKFICGGQVSRILMMKILSSLFFVFSEISNLLRGIEKKKA